MKINARWKTIATVGYSGPVVADAKDINIAAFGGCCLLQVRRTPEGDIKGRKVNSNGMQTETGPSWVLSADELHQWTVLGKAGE